MIGYVAWSSISRAGVKPPTPTERHVCQEFLVANIHGAEKT